MLVSAPTGSGKTLAAFLYAISELVEKSRHGVLDERVYVLYVSPLKALSNDIERNLKVPLRGIEDILARNGEPARGIRAMVRTGETKQGELEKMPRKTTPIMHTTRE